MEIGRCRGAGNRCVASGGKRRVEKVDGVCGAQGEIELTVMVFIVFCERNVARGAV